VTAEVEEVEAAEAPPSEATSNTRVAAARWPASELFKLPASLRPQPGQTLDLILLQKVLLLQSRRGYRANTDSMLLPWYAAYRLRECTVARTSPSLRVADLGAGHGLVGILAALQWPHARVVLYERQASLAALARRNLGLNGLSHPPGTAASPPDGPAPHTHALAASPAASPNAVTADTGLAALPPAPRGTVIECDLATPGALNAHYGAFDIVLSNPPFYAPSAEGAPRKGSVEKDGAWVESTLSIAGFVSAIADLLAPGGSAFVVYDRAEASRLRAALRREARRLCVTQWAAMVHEEGDSPDESGRRIFAHLVRGEYDKEDAEDADAGAELPTEHAATEELFLFALHTKGGSRTPDGGYTSAVAEWMRGLPPCHYSIRTPGLSNPGTSPNTPDQTP